MMISLLYRLHAHPYLFTKCGPSLVGGPHLVAFFLYTDVSQSCPSFCGPQTVSPLCSFTFFPCSDMSLPVAFRGCVHLTHLSSFQSIAHMLTLLQQCPNSTLWPYPFAPAPSLAICHRFQHLGFCSNGFLSLSTRFNASSDLSLVKCSTQDPQHSPSLVCVDA